MDGWHHYTMRYFDHEKRGLKVLLLYETYLML